MHSSGGHRMYAVTSLLVVLSSMDEESNSRAHSVWTGHSHAVESGWGMLVLVRSLPLLWKF